MGAQSTTKGFYDESFRAAPEPGSMEDFRRSMEQLARRIDIAMNRLDRLEATGRVTASTTLTASQRNVLVNTDGGAVTITLPAGVAGTYYRITNSGSSVNDVTVTPNGTEDLLGSNSSTTVSDGNSLVIIFDETDGWY